MKRFQIVQKSYDVVMAYIVKSAEPPPEDIEDMRAQTRAVMGEECSFEVEFVDDIAPSPKNAWAMFK